MEYLISRYTVILNEIKKGNYEQYIWEKYNKALDDIFEQMVRRESYGTMKQKPLVKLIEKIIKGDAAKAGETHKWYYDYYSLKFILEQVGFTNPKKQNPNESYAEYFERYQFENNYLTDEPDKNLIIEAKK